MHNFDQNRTENLEYCKNETAELISLTSTDVANFMRSFYKNKIKSEKIKSPNSFRKGRVYCQYSIVYPRIYQKVRLTLLKENDRPLFYIDGQFQKKDQSWRSSNGMKLKFTPWQNENLRIPAFPLVFNRTILLWVSFSNLSLLMALINFSVVAIGIILISLFRTSRGKLKTLVHLDVISANDTYVNGSRFRKNYFLCLNFGDQLYKMNPNHLLSSVPLDENDKFCEKNGFQHISIRKGFNKIPVFHIEYQNLHPCINHAA